MALKRCKECGGNVSSKAASCPGCGAPTKRKSSFAGVGCLVLIGIVVFVVYAANRAANTPEGRARAERREAERAAETAAKEQQKIEQQRQRADLERQRAEREAKLRQESPTFTVDHVVGVYASNEVAADEAWKDRVFKVEGEVDRIGKDLLGTSYVAFKCNRDPIRTVQCMFDDSHTAELSTLRPGQRVVIFGKCKGLMMNVLMDDCEFVTP